LRNRIAVLFLISFLLLCPVSCSQRKQSPPQEEGKKEEEGYLIFINEDAPGQNVLYSIGVSGSNKKKIYDKNPKSAAGYEEKIAFLAEEAGEQVLNVINADGSELISVVKGFEIKDNSFSWSPDGKRIIFIGRQSGDNSDELYYVEAGEDKVPVRITSDDYDDENPVFSKDGKVILYVKNLNGNRDIYRYDTSTRKSVNISKNEANDINPTPMPDKTKMLLLSDDGSKDKYNLYFSSLDGGGRTWLTQGQNVISGSVDSSPDSRMIAFVNVDNRKNKTVQVIDMEKTVLLIADDAYMVKWSRDGKKLYYAASDPENRKIVEYDISAKTMKDIFKVKYMPGQQAEGIKFLHFTEKLKK